jgi:hypothetical protein
VKRAVFKAANEKVTQNFVLETRKDLKLTVKHVTRKRSGFVSQFLYVRVTVHRDKFLFNIPTRRTNFSNLFWNETLHVADSSSVHHQ